MKRNFMFLFAGLMSFALLVGCAASNDVASNGIIQKRKYTKGFFVKTGVKKSSLKKSQQADILVEAPAQNTVTKSFTTHENEIAASQTPATIEKAENTSASVISTVEYAPVAETKTTAKQQILAQKEVKLTEKPSIATKLKAVKAVKKQIQNSRKANKMDAPDDLDPVLLYVLAFFIPFLAVGLVTDWDAGKVVLNLILTCLCGIPGIIHAFIVVSKNV